MPKPRHAPVDSFSGGWRMRVALATVLFSNPDLLLLDEPTNHLDLEATLWLESWLARFTGAALVVSHDQGLLDRSVQFIAHLDQRRLSVTPGGYAEFVRIRTEQAMQQAKAAERITAQRAHMQAFVDRFRASASKARQAQSRLKALEKMPVIDAVIEDTVTRFAFPEPARLAPPILSLDDVSVGYDGVPILRNLSMSMTMEETASRCSAPTATASPRSPNCSPEGWSRWPAACAGQASCAWAISRSTRRRSSTPQARRWTTSPVPCHRRRRPCCAFATRAVRSGPRPGQYADRQPLRR